MEKIMGMFWPLHVKADPNIVTRLGRVLHWAIAVIAIGVSLFGLATTILNGDFGRVGFWGGVVVLLITLLIGRGVRYILAGE